MGCPCGWVAPTFIHMYTFYWPCHGHPSCFGFLLASRFPSIQLVSMRETLSQHGMWVEWYQPGPGRMWKSLLARPRHSMVWTHCPLSVAQPKCQQYSNLRYHLCWCTCTNFGRGRYSFFLGFHGNMITSIMHSAPSCVDRYFGCEETTGEPLPTQQWPILRLWSTLLGVQTLIAIIR